MQRTVNHTIVNEENALGFNRGDEKALGFFYREFFPSLAHYSFQLIQNRSVAEEITSEAFVKAWKMHYKLNTYLGIKAYLYKIVHRDSIEAISIERKKTINQRYLPSPVDTDSPFDNMVRSEVYRLIHSALKELPPASRKVVMMHYLDGKSTGQISKELNLHPSTIKTQKKQGLNALKNVFMKASFCLLYFVINIFPDFL